MVLEEEKLLLLPAVFQVPALPQFFSEILPPFAFLLQEQLL